MIDWNPYLEALCNQYAQWWEVYTLTDVVGRQRVEVESPLLLDFMVETVQPAQEQPGEAQQKTERLGVLEGLRKYAADHVLLVGRPGSGKSTALARLLLEEAQKANLTPQPSSLRSLLPPRGGKGEQEFPPILGKERRHFSPLLAGEGQGERSTKGDGNQPKVPVLVELRYYRTSILDLIQDFLQRHDPNLTVDAEMVKTWLRQGQLRLLVDGVNELPSEEARRDLHKFRQDYQKTTPMIFTTRDLGVGGDLDITKKLEMQPLSEAQIQQFVCAYLPQQGEQMLRQLGSRLRELGETPLLLWMLCSLFKAKGKVPPNLALVFRQFAQSYYDKLKQDVPISDESRRWCQLILQHLAWRMTQGREATELQVAISQQEAEEILTAYLRNEGFAQPRDRAMERLTDLLKYHLLQLGTNNQIEFRHQLIQEHCTAESLLKLLPSLSDDKLKREYLNYLKWTEPLALMLELVEDEAQAVRVVKLALEVDLRLGARLAGVVKPEFQAQTVGLVARLAIPQLLKIQLLEITKSKKAIPELVKALNHEYSDVRRRAAEALGNIGSDATIKELVKALNHEDSFVRRKVAEALGKIGSDAAIPELVKALSHKYSDVRLRAAEALGKIGSDAAIPELVKALNHKYSDVRLRAVEALGNISSDAAIKELVKALKYEYSDVHLRAVKALGNICSDTAIPELVKALNDEDFFVRRMVVYILGKIGSDAALPELVKALNDEEYDVRSMVAYVLGKIGSDAAIPELVKALNDEEYDVRCSAVEALGKIGSDTAIPELVKTLNDEDSFVRRRAAEALGNIGSDAAAKELVKALNDEDSFVRLRVAEALGKTGSDGAILELVKALNHKGYKGYNIRLRAVEALGNIGSYAAIPELVKALNHEDYDVRLSAAEALGNIGSDDAIPELVKALNHKDYDVRLRAAAALCSIGSGASILELVKALNHKYFDIRLGAAESLCNIGSDAAIPELVKALNHEDYDVRLRASEALCNIGSDTAIPELVKALNHEYSSVCLRAVEALCNIGSDAAIPELVKALNHEDSDVRWRVAEALGKIASPELLPDLLERLKTDKETKLLDTISAIQERYKFYNYTLTQSSSASSVQCSEIPPTPLKKGGDVQSISIKLMHILHLSDLHFGTLDQANLWSNQLAADLYNDINIPHLDALILSGDIANYSTEEEYQAAAQFLDNLRQDFPLNPERIILVPGNHDLNWKLAKKAYKLIDRDDYDGQLIDGHYIEESASVIRVRDETQYKQRFAHFSSFYETIKQNPYPLDYDQQYTLDHLPEQNLLILGLNSAWQLDHHYKSRASINTKALSNALTQIRRNPDYRNCLKIAVWHHPLNSAWEDRITDHGFTEQLAVAGFRLYLHGHIHKAETSPHPYDLSPNGRKLDRICAGTFGAPVREWVPGYPLQYNLLKIADNNLTVYTRRREELNGAWKPDARWLQGAGKTPLDYYAIAL